MSSSVEESSVQSNFDESLPGQTLVYTNTKRCFRKAVGGKDLLNGFDVRFVDRHFGGQFPSEGIFTRLGIKGGASHRIQKNLALHVAEVWWMFLDLDELVFDHHLAHGLVR